LKKVGPFFAAKIQRLAQTHGILDGFPVACIVSAALADAQEKNSLPAALLGFDEHLIPQQPSATESAISVAQSNVRDAALLPQFLFLLNDTPE